ncbi:CTP synthase (glutamine hydrolyzing) [Helicobacter sp. 11S02629-2]|uniref:glutamine hydrolyzing CTP synthase n=1 Tax=Helicobacter sp. 11S02629-2 TaxID=1476195 RepID=UPI000BA64A1F|nr:CTP synthase (glutamine hydrolyzing) [Helicobacter sp. 11S02629-2]PAF45486.1 CTP synthase [Helicobacter sp. 11S02629-2]
MKHTRYIFVTGGVLSSLGKGITSSSIGTLLKHAGFSVSILKIDPYLNIDPGTMSPLEHGEVFVTKDGAETDLDIGHYERFLDTSFIKENNFTTGQVYLSVIEKERKGNYLGKTIQIVPHITDEIKHRIKAASKGKDFLIVELGGTVGDIEGMPFLESIRQLKHELGDDAISIHVTLVPMIHTAGGEVKTKPTQHSVQELRRIGISPQIIVARCEKALDSEIKKKIALSCDVAHVISAWDAASIYQCPLNFMQEKILDAIAQSFHMPSFKTDISEWDLLVKKILSPTKSVNIGFVGKYLSLKESYKSLIEALTHAGANLDTKINIQFIDSEKLTDANIDVLDGVDAILVPGGFGERGVEGKLRAIKYARTNDVVYLGICLGMQLAMIEYARDVLGLKDANSSEFDPNTANKIIYLIEEFLDKEGKHQFRTHNSPLGGTMRLGEYECELKPGSKLAKAYLDSKKTVFERHRHRYEANPAYKDRFEKEGLIVSGSCDGLIEAIELKDHKWFVGVQFHPEFTSRLQNPNHVILEFVKQALKNKRV